MKKNGACFGHVTGINDQMKHSVMGWKGTERRLSFEKRICVMVFVSEQKRLCLNTA
jgi:hypothetical protein